MQIRNVWVVSSNLIIDSKIQCLRCLGAFPVLEHATYLPLLVVIELYA